MANGCELLLGLTCTDGPRRAGPPGLLRGLPWGSCSWRAPTAGDGRAGPGIGPFSKAASWSWGRWGLEALLLCISHPLLNTDAHPLAYSKKGTGTLSQSCLQAVLMKANH